MNKWINYVPGAEISYFGKRYLITNVLNLEEVLGKSIDDGKRERLLIKNIELGAEEVIGSDQEPITNLVDSDLATITDSQWNIAQARFNIIKGLINVPKRNVEMVKTAAKKAAVSTGTIYRWISRFEETGKVSSLVSIKRDGGRGKSRLDPDSELILKRVIDDVYLNEQQRSVSKTIIEVKARCIDAKIVPPHDNTIRNRINALSDELKISRRLGKRKAKIMFNPTIGHFPGADYPLSVIQIDHTPLDIELVDEKHRLAIGKPWLTLAIDVYSRMIFGFYLSLDPPGDISVGLCLVQGILQKTNWLLQHDITTEWPIWGLPRKIHADNGREFHGKMLRRACEEYGIDLEWRPVATPNYGGHIERLLGTFLREVHDLPGTTFSNPVERGDYDSEAKAALTIVELERVLAKFMTGIYHQRFHKTLQMSPIKKFESGILGNSDRPGTGLPIRITEEEKLQLDFLPYFERTVQDYGVALDDIRYYSDILRRFINAKDPNHPQLKRKFIFKRDPRDISVIYFYDPELKRYYSIPYRNTSYPPISLWELKQIKKDLRSRGREEIDESLIFDTYGQMRRDVETAKAHTKKVRRANERIKRHRIASPSSLSLDPNPTPFFSPVETDEKAEKILPFTEIEIY